MNGTRVGTAFVDVQGDFTTLQQQVSTAIPGLSSKLGKGMAVGLAAGVGAAGVATKALYDVGAAFDDSFDKIRVGTGKTGKELNRLKSDFKNVVGSLPTDFDSASEAITGLSQRLDITGKPLRALSKQILELSRITNTDVKTNVQAVTRAFGDWEVKTRDQADALDFMFRASQKSGASVHDLAEKVVQFGAPLRRFGFEMEEAVSMFALFEKAGVNVQTMVPGLKLALSSFLEQGIDPEKGLLKTFKDIESGAIDGAAAIEIFGKRAGADMVEAISQGRFEFKDFTKVIANSKDTIRGAGRDTMDLSEHWQKFTNMLKVQVYPIAKDVFEGLGDLMKDVTKAFKQGGWEGVFDLLMERLQDALPKVQEFALKLGGKLAEGLVKGFQEAPILTTLFAGGALLKVFGGGSALGTAGKALGKKFGGAFGAGLITVGAAAVAQLVNESKNTIEGHGSKSLSEMFEGEFENIAKAVKTSIKDDDLEGLLEIRKLIDAMRDSAIESGEDVPKELDRLIKATDKARSKMGADLKGVIGKFDDFTDGGGDMADNFDKTVDKLSKDADRFKDAFSGAFQKVAKGVVSLDKGIGKGLDNIGSNTNSLLKGLKVGEVSYSIKKAGEALQGFQRGGPINLGAPSGDSVPAVLERGEYVLNRRAVAKVGKQNLDAINFQHAPRFQKGGGLDFALGPYSIDPIQYDANHAGGNSHWHITGTSTSWIVGLGKKLQSMGFMVGEHPAFGGVAPPPSHSLTGGHYDALAIDVNSAADETRAETAKVAALLGGAYAGAAALEKIKRVLLEGPDGPLKSGGQSALDMARSAANKLIQKAQAASVPDSGNVMSADGDVEKVFASVAKKLSNSKTATLALGMAGYAESGMRDLSYGDSTSQGALQLLSSTAAGLGVSPHDEGAIASIFFNQGFYGRGGANSLAASGLPAHLVAQNVQGSAFSDGSNYAAQAGPAKAWMQRFGLQKGGLVQMLAKGGQAGKGKGGPKFTGSMAAWKPGGNIKLGEPWKTAEKMRAALSNIDLWDERIGIADATAGIDGLFTGNERTHAIGLHVELLKKLSAARDFAKAGLTRGMTMLGRKSTPNWQKQMLREIVPTFTETLTEMQGVTGKGGRIFDTFATIAGLQGREVDLPTVPDSAQGGYAALGAAKGLAATLQERLGAVDVWDEQISIAQRLADADGVFSESERKKQIELTKSLLGSLYGVQSGAKRGFSFVNKSLPKAKGANAEGLLELRDTFLSALTGVEGLTGKGGRLLDAKLALQSLGVRPDSVTPGSDPSVTPDQSELLGLKLDQAMATIRRLNVGIAQNSVFAGQFATGGFIPAGQWGIAGERGPEIVQGPAQVHSNRDSQSMLKPEVRVVIEDNRTRVMVDGKEVEAIVDRRLDRVARGRSYAGAGRL